MKMWYIHPRDFYPVGEKKNEIFRKIGRSGGNPGPERKVSHVLPFMLILAMNF